MRVRWKFLLFVAVLQVGVLDLWLATDSVLVLLLAETNAAWLSALLLLVIVVVYVIEIEEDELRYPTDGVPICDPAIRR